MKKPRTFGDIGEWLAAKTNPEPDDIAIYACCILWNWSKSKVWVLGREEELFEYATAVNIPVNELAEAIIDLNEDPAYQIKICKALSDLFKPDIDDKLISYVDEYGNKLE